METFTVELITVNNCGVLHHIAGIFAKCQLNIETLDLKPLPEGLSRMRITLRGDMALRTHLLRLLSKLYDVKSAAQIK